MPHGYNFTAIWALGLTDVKEHIGCTNHFFFQRLPLSHHRRTSAEHSCSSNTFAQDVLSPCSWYNLEHTVYQMVLYHLLKSLFKEGFFQPESWIQSFELSLVLLENFSACLKGDKTISEVFQHELARVFVIEYEAVVYVDVLWTNHRAISPKTDAYLFQLKSQWFSASLQTSKTNGR